MVYDTCEVTQEKCHMLHLPIVERVGDSEQARVIDLLDGIGFAREMEPE